LLIVASIPLGLAFSIAIQTRPAAPAASDSSIRSVSAATILHLEEEQRTLKDSLRTLRAQVAETQQEVAARRTQLGGLSNQIAAQKAAAGLTDVRGPGVRVTLDDSQSRTVPVGTDPNLLIVHDYDLRDVVTVLWANGAEAIDINGQRLVTTTSIYCVGSTTLVNDTRLSPPYAVQATGPVAMQQALAEQTALTRFKGLVHQYGLGLSIAAANDLTVPAYDGRMASRSVAALEP
jgi:uncharacterized protein YlxW (UPF0749 family)